MAEYLVAIIIGAISSLIASVAFLFFLTRLKPKIVVSEHIARGLDSKGVPIYRIKIINKTKVPIINLRAQLHFMRPTVAPGGIFFISKAIDFQRSEVMELTRFDMKDNTAGYAYRFRTYENIDNLWNNDDQAHIRFRLYATHSVSAFGKVFKMKYHTKRNSIKDGDFSFGNSLEVK